MWSVVGLLDGTRSIADDISICSAVLYSHGSGDACMYVEERDLNE